MPASETRSRSRTPAGMVGGFFSMADGVALSCGEVMAVPLDCLGYLIPVALMNTCDQARLWAAGEAKV
ncbi:hypothetical protein [Nonomuraea coxensis]|uniref:hypothetical protein n=1 Tax=Nonomuraea coxensis TaxID=404386 RepID=UPI0012FCD2EC|nr:hypothetical protein [Nonomuraea coxensis]